LGIPEELERKKCGQCSRTTKERDTTFSPKTLRFEVIWIISLINPTFF
jgi:hypothetical protein